MTLLANVDEARSFARTILGLLPRVRHKPYTADVLALVSLLEHLGPSTVGTIRDELAVSQATASEIVARAQDAGRVAVEYQGRYSVVSLTSRAHREALMRPGGPLGPPPPRRLTDEDRTERFWSFVRRAGPDECWLWTGRKTAGGHGVFSWGSNTPAHRIACALSGKPLPAGAVGRHTCANAACVNPAHVEPFSHAENVAARVRAGRSAQKLTPEQVREIRSRALTESTRALARAFNITPSTCGDIIRRRIWKHVE